MKPSITLEECNTLIQLLTSDEISSQQLALNMLAADSWRHQGSVATAIYEARVELGYRKRGYLTRKVSPIYHWQTIRAADYKESGIINCLHALERVKKRLS